LVVIQPAKNAGRSIAAAARISVRSFSSFTYLVAVVSLQSRTGIKSEGNDRVMQPVDFITVFVSADKIKQARIGVMSSRIAFLLFAM
jgi:hypothetical protein